MSNKLFLTGSTGFVGKNLIDNFSKIFEINSYKRNSEIIINENIVIHLAGIAHDTKNTLFPEIYYKINTEFTKKIFDAFLNSDAKVFITLSSVKAISDKLNGVLTEESKANPFTHYGNSKLLAEQYILSKEIPNGKRVYILRPCMIHGPGNKGNLNLLFKLISYGIPWPLGAFENKRSFCSIENLMFIFRELIERDDILSGVYNVADDLPLSTNELVLLLAESQNIRTKICILPKDFIRFTAKVGNFFKLPFNEEQLKKLTDTYIVSNKKLLDAIGKSLPISSTDGLLKTFNSFKNS